MRLTVVAIVVTTGFSSARAQGGPLQVLRHTPSAKASPGNVITVTFDRPVAGRLEESVDAARVFRIEPAPPGQVLWRDPITIRFVPDQPLAPGSTYTVTIDTTFRAIDGSRLAAPYRFTFRVPGPVILARDFDFNAAYRFAALPVHGRIKLLYSAPVDESHFARGARLELPGCATVEVRLRLLRQRALAPDDPYPFRYAGGWDRDTVGDRFRRVVELAPESDLPPDCTGRLILPNTVDDSIHGKEESFGVRTAARFRIREFDCYALRACPLDNLVIGFTAAVKRDDVRRFVRLDPPAPLAYDEYPTESASWTVRIRLKPRTEYRLIVSDSLRDIHGRSLEGARSVKFATGDYAPSIGYPRGHLMVARSGPLTLPVRHINVRSVRVVSYRIPDALRSRVLAFTSWDEVWSLGLPAETVVLPLDATFNTEATTQLRLPHWVVRSAPALVALRVEIASDFTSPKADSSIVPIVVRAPASSRFSNDFTLLQVTDLAVHAKLAPGESNVLVTSLANGRPRAGAQVRQITHDGGVVAQGITGSDGVARLRTPPGLPVVPAAPTRPIANDWPPRVGLVEATLGADRVVMPLSIRRLGYESMNPMQPGSLGARPGQVPAATAVVLAERDIYRPGDMVYLKGIVRYGTLDSLTVPPARDSVRLRLTYRSLSSWDPDPDDDFDLPFGGESRDDVVIRDTVLLVSDVGTVSDSMRLRTGALLGTYVAELQVVVLESWRTVATQRLRVAEYRAPEFLVDASADSGIHRGGDTLRVHVSGKYLFGAPMGRASVTWSAVLHEAMPWEVRIPGAEGWTVGAWDWFTDGRAGRAQPRQLSGVDSLDAAGRAIVRVSLAELQVTRPGRMIVDVAVTDVNRQSVGASVTAQVHAGDMYILARQKTSTWFWRTGERTTVDIRAVRPDGSALSGVPVTVSVVRRHWKGSRDGTNPWTDEHLATDTIVTRDSAVAHSFMPGPGGWYEVRLTAPDGRGVLARTTLAGYVMGGTTYAWMSGSPMRLPLVVDQRELEVGQETRVAFDSPFDSADVWFTVERERVMEQRHIVARRGSNVVALRLAGQHIPNVFVSVMLRRRNPAEQRPDSASQLIRVGYAELRVKTAPKRLTVAVEPERREYRPGDTAVVRLRVRDAAGRGARGEVTLWAVDEGVLSLTGFDTPDLLARMYAPRGLGVGLWSTLPSLVTSDPGLAVTLLRGAAAMMSSVVATSLSDAVELSGQTPATMRTRFRPTAFYLASVRTDGEGNGSVRARLPDNLTTFRVMALVVDAGDRFGSGDTTLLVTRPLVVRPALPRFVRAGDTLHAGAAVNARDGRARPVAVHAAGVGIGLMGERRRDVALEQGKGAEARFGWAVPPRDSARDSVAVQLRASDGTHEDAVETRLPVRPDFHPRAHTRMGMLRDAADVVLDLPAGTDAARSTLFVQLGTSPLAPMLAAYDRLRVYPYYCTEQIASTGRALAAIWRVTRDRDANALGGDPRPRLQELADAIARRQLPSGAIRYWDDYHWTTPWLSAYAGLFLLEARDAGAVVSDATLSRLSDYLTRAVAAKPDTGGMNRFERQDRRLALGGRVAIVEYLRRAGSPNLSVEDHLLAVAPSMTWEDRLRLAEVVAPRDDARGKAEALVDSAWRAVVTAGRRVDLPDSAFGAREFPSRISPAARLLTASLAVRPAHPRIGGLIETVLQHGRAEGQWAWSTQDYASVVLALAKLPEAGGAERRVRVSARGKVIIDRDAGASKREAPLPLEGLLERDAEGRPRLRLRLTSDKGASPLYFAVTVTEVPSQAPVTPDIKGIVVERWYERFDTGKPVTSVEEGDLVRVRLRVTVPSDRQYVALEDPLPAGLEPLDMSLRTTALKSFVTPESERVRTIAERDRDGPQWQSWLYGRWDDGWWSPWEHKALHDDRVVYFARMLWTGSYSASYVARATTAGTFVRPPAHAEEMYNPALQGRSDGGRFVISRRAN